MKKIKIHLSSENEVLKVLQNYQGILKAKTRINASANPEIALIAITEAIEVIQSYRAIGTIEEFKQAKAIESAYAQVKWERDIAISQLEEIGVGLGQKMDDIKALKEKRVRRNHIFSK